MSYTVRMLSPAKRGLKRIDRPDQARIVDAIDRLADNPRPAASDALSGTLRGLRKLRVGSYRIIYRIDDDGSLVVVGVVGNRRDAYDQAERLDCP